MGRILVQEPAQLQLGVVERFTHNLDRSIPNELGILNSEIAARFSQNRKDSLSVVEREVGEQFRSVLNKLAVIHLLGEGGCSLSHARLNM